MLTHAYEGGHPDHDATALAVHLACRLLGASRAASAAVEFAGYHDPDGSGTTAVQSSCRPTGRRDRRLGDGEQALKRGSRLPMHPGRVLRRFPLDRERYREAPAYDFLATPHPWRPLYEPFVDTMTGERWRAGERRRWRAFGVSGPI